MAKKDEEQTQEPADTYHRHGAPDPSLWEEQAAVTGRPVDEAPENSTFGTRAKTATKAVKVEAAEDKSVKRASTKKASS